MSAQSIAPLTLPTDRETITLWTDGQFVSPLGDSTISLSMAYPRFAIFMTPPRGRRRQYQLEGVDKAWREVGSDGFLALRFFDAQGAVVSQQLYRFIGETPGWNGSLERPVFTNRRETVTAPPLARSFWIVISSAGPPEALGTILVKGITVSRKHADGSTETILRAPLGEEVRSSPAGPAPTGFTTDGLRPKMAQLLTLPASPPARAEECFAILDNDLAAHAEWRTLKESASEVSGGDQLEVDWDEAYSIGLGSVGMMEYERPRAGTYRFRVRPIDLLGRPDGAQTTLLLSILGPWWQRGWFWMAVAGAVGLGAIGVNRHMVNQRIRRQLTRLKEERLLEEERLRIARDIHDTLAQGLTGIIVQLEAAEDAQTQNLIEENRDHLRRASDLARESLQEARRSVFALRPQVLEERDLSGALRELLAKWTAGTSLQAELTVEGTPRKLSAEIEQNLLRIGLEALTNALRHAQARRFAAKLTFGAETVQFELKDDGCGFDLTGHHEGYGLVGMKERAQLMAGRLSVESSEGSGTTISLALPVSKRSKLIPTA